MQKKKNDGLYKYFMDRLEIARSKNISKQQILDMIKEEVFSQPDFKRHVKETSEKLGIPIKAVDYVVKHHITTMALQMTLVTRIRRRLSMYAFFMIEIKDEVTETINQKEEWYVKKFGKRRTEQLLSIFKNLKQ